MLGLETSIHTASTSIRGMGPRLKAEDDGECGWRSRQTRRQRTETHHNGCFIRPALTTPSLCSSQGSSRPSPWARETLPLKCCFIHGADAPWLDSCAGHRNEGRGGGGVHHIAWVLEVVSTQTDAPESRPSHQPFRAISSSSLSLSGRTMPVPVETGEKPYI